MKSFMMMTLLAGTLLAASPGFGAQVSIGIRIGPPPPPRVVRVMPVQPGPDFVWVDGYWYPVGNHYKWHEGYWTRAPYAGARWYSPRYEGGEFFEGYWQGDRGRFEHEHRWDKHHERDYRWNKEHEEHREHGEHGRH